MTAFSTWLSKLKYGWVLLAFAAVMVGLYYLFDSNKRTKPVKGQLLVLCGMDFVTLLFYILTFSLRISKLAKDAGATPRTVPRLWALLMLLASIGAFVAVLKQGAEPDEKFNKWVFALLVGVGSIFSVILFNYIGYYLSSAAFIVLVMYAMGERNKLQLIITPVVWCIFTYVVFYKLLFIKLPFGLLFSWIAK